MKRTALRATALFAALVMTACAHGPNGHQSAAISTLAGPCSAAEHDQYVTTWNGGTYRTWHPQIDPETGCSFDHEHGSSPEGFAGGLQPVFDAFAGKRSQATGNIPVGSEAHNGFKMVVFDVPNVSVAQGSVTTPRTISVMRTEHTTGTMGTHRLCQMFHSANVAFSDKATGEILANFMFKGDYGKPVAQVAFGVIHEMRHADCPQLADLQGIHGSISSPMAPADMQEANGYETWVQSTYGIKIPLKGKFILRVDETAWQCDETRNAAGEYTCAQDYRTLENGLIRDNIERWFDMGNGFGPDTTLPGRHVGSFCTDYTALFVLPCTSPDAVPQYVKPGIRFALPNIRFRVPPENIVNTGPNAFKFVPGEPGERNYNLGGINGSVN